MNDLGAALRELVDGQQPVGGYDAGELWRQGRRRVRRHRAIGAGIVAAVALAIGVTGALVPQPTVVMPAGQPHRDAVPRSIYVPSKWLAGTDDRGPLGRLAALGGAPRAGQKNGSPGIFGISARTGEYRFLDLPDRADRTDVKLSPDGRHVAYWLTGKTAGTPYSVGDGDVVTGIARYDTVTGRLTRYDVPSKHGLSTGGLAWMDDSTIALEYGFLETAHTSSGFAGREWKAGTAAPVLGIQRLDFSSLTPNPDGSYFEHKDASTFVQVERRSDTLMGGRGIAVLTLPEMSKQPYTDATTEYTQLSQSGRLVAVVLRNATTFSEPLVTGTVDDTGKVQELVLVDKLQDVQVLGWQDDHTVLVLGHLIGKPTALMSVDLRGRHARQVGVAEPSSTDPGLQVTRELVGTPLARGLRPPDPMDPRIRRGAILGGGLVLVGAGLLLMRRRHRA
jgi:hypothetical protein